MNELKDILFLEKIKQYHLYIFPTYTYTKMIFFLMGGRKKTFYNSRKNMVPNVLYYLQKPLVLERK